MFDDNVGRRRLLFSVHTLSLLIFTFSRINELKLGSHVFYRDRNLRQHSSNIQLFSREAAYTRRYRCILIYPNSDHTHYPMRSDNKEFGVWCVVGSPVWKPRDMLSESVGGGGAAAGAGTATTAANTALSAPTTLPRSQRPAPRAHHLSASRKSLAPDHRH